MVPHRVIDPPTCTPKSCGGADTVHCDDRQIMRLVQDGEHALFDELASRYRPRLLRFAVSKVGDRGRAEDIVQEAFLAAFAARDSYDATFSFSTWMWTILINLCRREFRKRARRPAEVSHSALNESHGFHTATPVVGENGLSQLLLSERREQVVRLLDTLTDVQADALRLRFYGELQYDEIAETMNCSVSGAKRRVRTGLLALAARLERPPQRGDLP